MNLMVES